MGDNESWRMEKYDDAISFENLHKFYAYSSEKGGNRKEINLTRAQWNKISKDSPVIKTAEPNYKVLDINTTKLGTNPYYQGSKVITSDIKTNVTSTRVASSRPNSRPTGNLAKFLLA